MKNQSIVVSTVVLLASGCGYGAPYTNPGPSWSIQGLQVGIAGANCSARQDRGPMVEANDKTQDFFDLELKLKNGAREVQNSQKRACDYWITRLPRPLRSPPTTPRSSPFSPARQRTFASDFRPSTA